MGRNFERIDEAELYSKLFAAASQLAVQEPGYDADDIDGLFSTPLEESALVRLSDKIVKDLSKVKFDTENIHIDGAEHNIDLKGLIGFHTLANGLTFLGVQAGGDWEYPIFFIIYSDGKSLRAYIPDSGNPWNKDTKRAFGNDELADKQYMNKTNDIWNKESKKYKIVFEEGEDVGPLDHDVFHLLFDRERILNDINERFVEKEISVKSENTITVKKKQKV